MGRANGWAVLLALTVAVPALAQSPPPDEPAADEPAANEPAANEPAAPDVATAPAATAPEPPTEQDCDATLEVPKASPEEYPRLLREARQAIEQLRYDDALALVAATGSDAPPNLRVEALEISATVHLISGRAALAQPLLQELYFLAPAFRLNDASLPPRVTKMFSEEAARPHTRAVEMKLDEWGEDPRNYRISAGGASHSVSLACRAGASGAFAPLQSKLIAGHAHFRLPNAGSFECHGVAVDEDGLALGRFGSSNAPHRITTRVPGDDESIAEKWWFWTTIGGVVTASIVATVVLTSQEPDIPPTELTVEPQALGTATILRW